MATTPTDEARPGELPVRLTRLRVKNFRSIADLDIPLHPLTVLVGANGSGKSNVVDALRFVTDVFDSGLDQAVMDREGMSNILHRKADQMTAEMSVGLDASFLQQRSNRPMGRVLYDFTLAETSDKGPATTYEHVVVEPLGKEPFSVEKKAGNLKNLGELIFRHNKSAPETASSIKEQGAFHGPDELLLFGMHRRKTLSTKDTAARVEVSMTVSRLTHGFERAAEDFGFYETVPLELRPPQKSLLKNRLSEAAENLSAILKQVHDNGGHHLDDLREILGRTVQGVVDFSVQHAGSYLITNLHYAQPDGTVRKADLGVESDGTLRILALLAACYQPSPPPLMVFEEPETGIHPGALAMLAGVLKYASLRSQVIVTTHSPELLDHLPVESFLVVEKVNDETRVGPLEASQLETVRQKLFFPGELLRMEGLHRQTEPEA